MAEESIPDTVGPLDPVRVAALRTLAESPTTRPSIRVAARKALRQAREAAAPPAKRQTRN